MHSSYSREKIAVLSLAAIMAFRMLGLFMILPVFSVVAQKDIIGANSFLIGVALGIYGLTQALLQIPFGTLSDHFGRKPIIAVGLILFVIGSTIGACTQQIGLLIVARAMQGAGAIGSTVLALVSDLTRDEFRTRAMAIMGLVIGIAFSIAMIIGPLINHWFELSGIFWATAVSGIIGLILLFTTVPTPPAPVTVISTEKKSQRFLQVLSNTQLLRLNLGIFTLHAILTATFIIIPIFLSQKTNLNTSQQVILYSVVLISAFVLALPLIVFSEKKRQIKTVLIFSICLLGVTEILLLLNNLSFEMIGSLLLIFFTAFTILEASLPSLISKTAPIHSKGAAMGVYSSSQFFGIFIGGTVGGWVFSHFGEIGVFLFCAGLSIIWLSFAISMKNPPYLSTVPIPITSTAIVNAQTLYHQLRSLAGVSEIAIIPAENMLYAKIDKKIISEHELRNQIGQGNLR